MRIDIVCVFPDIFSSPFSNSIIKKATNKKLVDINIHNLRDYGLGKRKKIDDYPYGGGNGMVIRIEPVYQCFSMLISNRQYDEIIFMTPDGDLFSQKYANDLSLKKNIIILCGRYKGIDQRIRDHLISKELSIGKYILSGGELAAAVVIESIVRLLPGVINKTSVLTDSFQKKSYFISPPIYTRPSIYKKWKVPNVLLSGNHKKIKKWFLKKSLQSIKKKLDF
ncbi:tRNA (guanosine(37)-N1)-methyltransferase TrmD [Blattabacterium cuenoti]|uniref:tRNA (guanosine(37)-N1)-methyltransferase TrmD n=1 Tax=Blattabacterium cuenoti TaxID=1653831 RepID=UPI00163BC7E5|nr:tRNA (guanosine(37)-N1)-methyltransferase TrmD [Blattabacterium cuenoti]